MFRTKDKPNTRTPTIMVTDTDAGPVVRGMRKSQAFSDLTALDSATENGGSTPTLLQALVKIVTPRRLSPAPALVQHIDAEDKISYSPDDSDIEHAVESGSGSDIDAEDGKETKVRFLSVPARELKSGKKKVSGSGKNSSDPDSIEQLWRRDSGQRRLSERETSEEKRDLPPTLSSRATSRSIFIPVPPAKPLTREEREDQELAERYGKSHVHGFSSSE